MYSSRPKRLPMVRSFSVIAWSAGILIGIMAVRHQKIAWSTLAIGLYCGGLLVALRQSYVVALSLLVGTLCGWYRGTMQYQLVKPLQDLYGQTVTVRGTATLDGVYGSKADLAFRLQADTLLSPVQQPVAAIIKVSGYGERSIVRNDTVIVTGKLSRSRGSAIGSLSFAQLEVQDRSASPLEKLRLYFGAGLQSALPEPHGSLGLGLLIGQRTTLSEAFQEQLTVVGLVHIIAVSGYNLTILVTAAKKLLGKLSKYQSLVASFALIAVFLIISGLAASLVRAAVISSLSLLAGFYGRRFKPVVLLLFAAALTCLYNPQYLWFDIGWYLSFVAFAGVILVAPTAKDILYGSKEPKLLGGLLIETISAQLTTLPLILLLFGRLSIAALPANIAIVPLLPLTMLCCVIAGLAGMTHIGVLAGIAAWPARWLLGYIVEATVLFSGMPMAETTFYISGGVMVFLYAVLAAMVYVHYRRRRVNTLKYAII